MRDPTRTLTRTQVRALSRSLQRKGRKLPGVNRCTLLQAPRVTGGEVCHAIERGKHVYYRTNGFTPYMKQARRQQKFGGR